MCGGVERRGCLGLALEAGDERAASTRRLHPEQLGPDQLHRHRPRQHAVAGAPDLAHAAVVELLLQVVAAELLQPADHNGREHRHRGGEVGRRASRAPARGGAPAGCRARGRRNSRAARWLRTRAPASERPARRSRHEDREDHDPYAEPRDRTMVTPSRSAPCGRSARWREPPGPRRRGSRAAAAPA